MYTQLYIETLSAIIAILRSRGQQIFVQKMKDDIIIFESYDPEIKLKINNLLSSLHCGKVISNKTKPIFLKVSFSNYENDILRFTLFQKNARAKKVTFDISYDDLEIDLLKILNLYYLNYKSNKKINTLEIEFNKKIFHLEKKLFLSTKHDLSIKLEQEKILSDHQIEKVIFTYNYYINMYDYTTFAIDDGKQKNETDKQNQDIKYILDLCIEISEENSFELTKKG